MTDFDWDFVIDKVEEVAAMANQLAEVLYTVSNERDLKDDTLYAIRLGVRILHAVVEEKIFLLETLPEVAESYSASKKAQLYKE